MIDTVASTTTTPTPTDNQVIGESRGEEQRSQFLQLLIAQIKGQDPLNPMDGTEFVSQLSQFTSVEELINIREVMERVEAALEANGPVEQGDGAETSETNGTETAEGDESKGTGETGESGTSTGSGDSSVGGESADSK